MPFLLATSSNSSCVKLPKPLFTRFTAERVTVFSTPLASASSFILALGTPVPTAPLVGSISSLNSASISASVRASGLRMFPVDIAATSISGTPLPTDPSLGDTAPLALAALRPTPAPPATLDPPLPSPVPVPVSTVRSLVPSVSSPSSTGAGAGSPNLSSGPSNPSASSGVATMGCCSMVAGNFSSTGTRSLPASPSLLAFSTVSASPISFGGGVFLENLPGITRSIIP